MEGVLDPPSPRPKKNLRMMLIEVFMLLFIALQWLIQYMFFYLTTNLNYF